jgi:hypothetical protein
VNQGTCSFQRPLKWVRSVDILPSSSRPQHHRNEFSERDRKVLDLCGPRMNSPLLDHGRCLVESEAVPNRQVDEIGLDLEPRPDCSLRRSAQPGSEIFSRCFGSLSRGNRRVLKAHCLVKQTFVMNQHYQVKMVRDLFILPPNNGISQRICVLTHGFADLFRWVCPGNP